MDVGERVERLLVRADEVHKAIPARGDPEPGRRQVEQLLDEAGEALLEVGDPERQLDLAARIAQRREDLDREGSDPLVTRREHVIRRAPTRGVDPRRVPPGQHLTAGFPVLHVGRAPSFDPTTWRFTVTGLVGRRLVLGWEELRSLPAVSSTSDFHCVTGWSRLDNTWTGVRVRELLDRAQVRPSARHVVVSGHPAYSANLELEILRRDDALLAWTHDGRPLPVEHGGPLRLVVPSRYGWKSVKWAFELRLVGRDVRGYWEERGYHDRGDPFREERYRG